MSLPRRISGKVILVISGRSRMMYQSLEPEPEGAILSKRSVPQGSYSTPHDAGASMANWLKTNIQGFVAEALRDIVVNYVCRDRADHLWQYGVRSKPACRPRRTAVRGCRLIDTRKPGRPTCGLRKACRSVG